ncbi:MAG: M14 family metallopeptidase [Vicinamibacterales bacterium]
MSRCICSWSRLGIVLATGIVLGGTVVSSEQAAGRPAPVAPSRIAIAFNDYHGYTGTVDYLKKVASANPSLTELVEIGRSTKGRPIYVLVVTNMKTGVTIDSLVPLRNMRQPLVKNVTPMKPYQGKPAQWIDGGTHGNEYTGTEVCLYIIDKLLSAYGSDKEITRLVDDNTFYICPIVNPDGVYNSVEAGVSQRQNTMMRDDDNDGKVNEDGPDDLDGDGLITQFRYKDPKGAFHLSDSDSRVMVRAPASDLDKKERYSVITEDKDNDGDGRRGEDPERGVDVNRNFPEGWFRDDDSQGGSGAYPSSSPEARAVLEFFTNHTNIFMVQSFHTSGGFTYRPLARWPDSRIDPKDLAVYDRVMGRKYLELIGETPSKTTDDMEEGLATQAPQIRRPATPAGQAPGRGGTPALQARGWRAPYNAERNAAYGYGVFLDWAYAQFGSYSMSTELWNWQRDTRGLPGYAGEDDRAKWESAYIAHQEKAMGGRAFVPWKPFKHPELGEGEIGGWVAKYGGGNAIPGDSLVGVCETHWQFERFKATLLPRVEITDATARVVATTTSLAGQAVTTEQGGTVTVQRKTGNSRYRIVEVKATVANTGQLATHVARGPSLRGNRDDVVWLLGDRDKITYLQGSAWIRLGVLDGTMAIPGYEPRPVGQVQLAGRGGGGGRGAGAAPAGVPPLVRQQRPEAEAETPQSGPTRQVTWLVAIEGDSPLKVVLSSQKGGTRVKDLVIN